MTMSATKIRPVTDLRNKYPEVEKDIADGPVMLKKKRIRLRRSPECLALRQTDKRNKIYESIAKSETAINAELGLDAKTALKKTRAKLKI